MPLLPRVLFRGSGDLTQPSNQEAGRRVSRLIAAPPHILTSAEGRLHLCCSVPGAVRSALLCNTIDAHDCWPSHAGGDWSSCYRRLLIVCAQHSLVCQSASGAIVNASVSGIGRKSHSPRVVHSWCDQWVLLT